MSDKDLLDAVEDILETGMSYRLKVKSLEAILSQREDSEAGTLQPPADKPKEIGWVPTDKLRNVMTRNHEDPKSASIQHARYEDLITQWSNLLPHEPVNHKPDWSRD